MPKNILRRAFGVFFAFSPLLLLVASLIVGIINHPRPRFAMVGFMLVATAISLLNFYLSFIRSFFYFKKNRTRDGYRFVSGIPIFGSVFLILGGVFGFGAIGTAIVGLVSFMLDTGGSGWFVIATWRDQGLWDSRTN